MASNTESWQRFRSMGADLAPTERGYLAEIWVRGRHMPGSEGQRRIDVLRTSGVDEGKVQRRVVDAVEGDMVVEIKDIIGPIDRDQFEAFVDTLQAPDGGKAMFQKGKYVFANPRGAIANLEFIGERMETPNLRGRLTADVFNHRGEKLTARTLGEAIAIKEMLLREK